MLRLRETWSYLPVMNTAPAIPRITSASLNFVFIDDSNPLDAKSRAKRKLVRSQAARGPHSNTAVPAGHTSKEIGHSSMTTTTTSLSKRDVLKRKRNRVHASEIRSALDGVVEATCAKALDGWNVESDGILVETTDHDLKSDEAALNKSKSSFECSSTTTTTPSTPITRLEHEVIPRSSSNRSSIHTTPGAGWVAPFVSHPDPDRPYIPMLIDHYSSKLATDIPELDAGNPFLLRRRWFPMVITSPATLYVVLLTAASHYAATNGLLPLQNTQEVLLSLKQKSLTSINTLIQQVPLGGIIDDSIIAAVAKLASYEAMFGTPASFHTHMRGLQRMVAARGGLEQLGLGGLLMRMLLWIDINGAFLLNEPGASMYFAPRVPLAGHVAVMSFEPNMGGFLGYS